MTSNNYDFGPQHAGHEVELSDIECGLGLLGLKGEPPINYEAHVRAFHELRKTQEAAHGRRRGTIQQLGVDARTAGTAGAEQLIEEQYWEIEASFYQDAVHGAGIIAVLGPLFETVFKRAFRSLGERWRASPWPLPNHARWSMGPAKQWDCTLSSRGSSILNGILELVEATALGQYLPSHFEHVLQALFQYRNFMMHRGLEWPETELQKFAALAASWPGDFFKGATTDGKPSFYYPGDRLVNDWLSLLEQVVEAFGVYERCNRPSRPEAKAVSTP